MEKWIGLLCTKVFLFLLKTTLQSPGFENKKHTDHFGIVNGTICQLFKSKRSIQNLFWHPFWLLALAIHSKRNVSVLPQNVYYYSLAGS